MIYLGSDHGGIQLKAKIKDYLARQKLPVQDLGYFDETPSDYPLISQKVAQKVLENKHNLGILICKSGQGVCVAANKIKGVRAALAWKPSLAKAARQDDHINILCLSADYVDTNTNLKIVSAFLQTKPFFKLRYLRRLKQIKRLEKNS